MRKGSGERVALLAAAAAVLVLASVRTAASEEPLVPVPRRSEPAKLNVPPATSELKKPAPAAPTGPAIPVSGTESAPTRPAPSAPATLPASNPATLLPPAAPTQPGAAVTLKYKFQTNELVYFDVTHTMTITTQKDSTTEAVTNVSRSIKHFRVVSVENDGTALLEPMIDRVQMAARFGQGDPVTFDSESKETPPVQFSKVQDSIGKPLARLRMTPTGELMNVVRLGAPAPAPAPAGETPDNDPSNNFLIPLPKTPVTVGQTWSDKIDVKVSPSKGLTSNITVLRKYELAAVEGTKATIQMTSSVLTPVRDQLIAGQLIQRTPAGTIVFDMAAGQIVSRTMKLDKTEVGIFGDNSSMRAVSSQTDITLPREAAVRIAKEPADKFKPNVEALRIVDEKGGKPGVDRK